MISKLSSYISKAESSNAFVAIALVSMMCAFVFSNIGELSTPETFPDYYDNVKPFIDNCDHDALPETRGALKWLMLCVSHEYFGSERILPYLFSIMLLPTTFVFVRQLVKSNVAGLVAVAILITSGTFTNFDTTATYEQSWVFFLLWAFILLMRGNIFLPVIFFALAFFSKPLALIYLPTFLLANHLLDNKHKSLVFGMFFIVGSIITVKLLSGQSKFANFGGYFVFNSEELLNGLYNWWFYLDASLLVAMTLPIIIYKLIIMIKKDSEKKTALIILSGIASIIFSVPLIDGFTDQLNHAYRFTPMIILAGSAIGLIIKDYFQLKKQVLANQA